MWHVLEQPSPLVPFPSSHCSPAAAFRWPSPQNGSVQSELQVAVSTPIAPGSHCSTKFSTRPLPHTLLNLHCALQPLPSSIALPSSQSSVTKLRCPSPHTGNVQSLSHPSVSRT